MIRFWVSWWTGNYADEGCTKPPFQVWNSGSRDRAGDNERDDISMCAVIDAESETQIWDAIKSHFPDYEMRFCHERESDWTPGDRFVGYEGRTTLHEVQS